MEYNETERLENEIDMLRKKSQEVMIKMYSLSDGEKDECRKELEEIRKSILQCQTSLALVQNIKEGEDKYVR